MKTMLLTLFLLTGTPPADSLQVLFWNLENFFDWRADSTGTSELEFSSRGPRHWTRKRFHAKCNAVAKALLWADAPDVIGLAEIENRFVLKQLLEATALGKLDYRIVHYDSPDPRGIDVALLYRASRLEVLDAKPCHIYAADSTVLPTRDILLVRCRTTDDGDIAFLVNHHPSKYGGAKVSEARRERAVKRLRELADSLQNLGMERIVAMGDMNETPDNPVFHLLAPALESRATPLWEADAGTIRFDGRWELIDHFYVSPSCRAGPMRILHIPFLQTKDSAHGGLKPLRTYTGPRYQGGVSDHCPVEIRLPLDVK